MDQYDAGAPGARPPKRDRACLAEAGERGGGRETADVDSHHINVYS
jgi:hypothetical protein